MRELKFRIWDKEKKIFLKRAENCFGQIWFQETENSITPVEVYRHLDFRYSVQQFTGLKDKNGKEIYEGDVIRGKFDMGPAGMTINTAIVRWTNEEGYQWNYWDLPTIEVVGNMFENEIQNQRVPMV